MDREAIELAQRATEEGWDNFRLFAEYAAFQKERDAQLAETMGATTVAAAIRIS